MQHPSYLFPLLKHFRMKHSRDLAKAQRRPGTGDVYARRDMKSGQSKGLSERERLHINRKVSPHGC